MKTNGKKDILTIIIGGDMDLDLNELFSGKPLTDLIQSKNTLYLESYAQLNKLLSPAKLDLFHYLLETQPAKLDLFHYLLETQFEDKPKSISEIAKDLQRHQEAISRDIAQLKGLGLVLLKKFKRTVYAIPMYSSIDIRIC